MEPAKAAPLPNFGSVARTVTKILRLRRSAASSAGGATVAAAGSLDAIGKLKLCRDFGDYSGVFFESSGDDVLKPENEKKQQKEDSSRDKEALESFVANLFASISAFKAAYAQLQVAQYSYDLDLIQSTDATIVAELRRMSELKRSYFRKQSDGVTNSVLQPALAAQLQELSNLTKTYRVTTRKLEEEIELKESEINALRAELLESDRKVRVFEAKLHPNRSLAALEALHLSGVNPTHFLTVLRYCFKAIRSFVQLMEKEMESAGWDLHAAAVSIQADVLHRGKLGHRTYAFESYVCRRMFSDFSHQSFGLSDLGECSAWDRRKFFDEFTQVKSLSTNHILDGPRSSPVAQFCRAKYLSLVRPKMASSFFGDQEKRDSEFFAGFTEMARRVWLLHCLFFSFEAETERSIFQIRRGVRFSEVYMESVTAAEDKDCAGEAAAVGFTVVPGFRVARTLIQCKVYLISEAHRRS